MEKKSQSKVLNACLEDLHKSLNDKLNEVNEERKFAIKSSSKALENITMAELVNLRDYYAREDKKLRECYERLIRLGAPNAEINQIVAVVKQIDKLHKTASDIIKDKKSQTKEYVPTIRK